MKLLIVLIAISLSSLTLASEALYNALDVEGVDIPVQDIMTKTLKSVGGLNCVFTDYPITYRAPKPYYECEVGSKIDPKAIYEALDVKEIGQMAPRTRTVLMKSVGSLECVKTRYIRVSSNTSYNCKFQIL